MVDAVVTFAALVVSVLALFSVHRRWDWALAPASAAVLVPIGVVPSAIARAGVQPLLAPLGFILAAVPMAVMLDRLGLFRVVSERVAGAHVLGRLWVLAAVVTALLNLDAAVVLLTPLYVDIARRHGLSGFALGLQPALLSGLASLPLPFSNLTNLIVDARTHASAGAFLVHLGPAALGAVAAGWLVYRARYAAIVAASPPETAPAVRAGGGGGGRLPLSDTAVLAGGLGLVAVVVAGFIAAPALGGAPWEVAAGADVILVGVVRAVPVRAVPLRSALTVAGLGVLVAGIAGHVDLSAALAGERPGELVRTIALETGLSGAFNNLPAVLVSARLLGHAATDRSFAVLIGTNVGSLLVPTGSVALFLWVSLMRGLGIAVTPRRLLPLVWPVALAGLVCATGLFVLTTVISGGR